MSELASFDGNADGVDDTWTYDTNNDGIADQAEFDTTGDGYSDQVSVDTDLDGDVDQIDQYDASGALISSTVDLDDDGVADETYDGQGNLTSGTTDTATTDPTATDPTATDPTATDPTATDPTATDPTATDPTATADPAVDGTATTTDPGLTDYTFDTNADGTIDQIDTYDVNDVRVSSQYDTDMDGDLDLTENYDASGNVVSSVGDSNNDGVADEYYGDTDGDGIADSYSYDVNGDGVGDNNHGGMGGVHGVAEDQYYQAQAVSGECGPTSVAMIISEHVGSQVPYEEVMQLTYDSGYMQYNEDGSMAGITMGNVESLLESYGVDANVETGNPGTLEQYLDEGKDIIVGVDGDEIWGTGDAPTWNHFLVVTSIDEDSGMVTLNDPGNPDGSSYQLPLDQFLGSWEESGNEMVVTTDGGPDGVGAADAGTGGAMVDDGAADETGGAMATDAPVETAPVETELTDAPAPQTEDHGFALLNMMVKI